MTAIARHSDVGSQVQGELLPARITSQETVEQRAIAGLRQPSAIAVDEAVAIVPEEVETRAGCDLRVQWKAVRLAVRHERGRGPLSFFSFAGTYAGVIVEIQARAGVERSAQPVVGTLMEPEEIEIGHDTHAGVRARAERVGVERRPLEPMVAVDAPTIHGRKHREPAGERGLLLGREGQACHHRRDAGRRGVPSIEGHVPCRSQ